MRKGDDEEKGGYRRRRGQQTGLVEGQGGEEPRGLQEGGEESMTHGRNDPVGRAQGDTEAGGSGEESGDSGTGRREGRQGWHESHSEGENSETITSSEDEGRRCYKCPDISGMGVITHECAAEGCQRYMHPMCAAEETAGEEGEPPRYRCGICTRETIVIEEEEDEAPTTEGDDGSTGEQEEGTEDNKSEAGWGPTTDDNSHGDPKDGECEDTKDERGTARGVTARTRSRTPTRRKAPRRMEAEATNKNMTTKMKTKAPTRKHTDIRTALATNAGKTTGASGKRTLRQRTNTPMPKKR